MEHLQYLLEPDGAPRDHCKHRLFQLTACKQRISPKPECRSAGFDLEKHECDVVGDNLRQPLTKWQGSQIEAILEGRQ
jgi:hypothetical protein